jgi:[glutamine synthetase] adenylyltransferase / [glutamine synthetase]-adenylyl-L-tyrosine phosphorylase
MFQRGTIVLVQSNRPDPDFFADSMREVSREEAENHIANLPNRYFEIFEVEKQLYHFTLLKELSVSDPYRIITDTLDEGLFGITIISYDFPSEFSIITGLLGTIGFNIVSGDAFTLKQSSDSKSRSMNRKKHQRDLLLRRWRSPANISEHRSAERRKIIDRFTGKMQGSISELEKEFKSRFDRFTELLISLSSESMETAKEKISDEVAETLSRQNIQIGKALHPVQITVEPSEKGDDHPTLIKVVSEDTPFFLYALSTALMLRQVSIEHVNINTRHGIATDSFEVIDLSGEPIRDETKIKELKLSILFTKQFTYFLPSAPDPYSALSRFETLLRKLININNQEQLEENISRPTFLKDLAKLLGASDFLWEDFIRTQYENIIPLLNRDGESYSRIFSSEDVENRLKALMDTGGNLEEKKKILNDFKDREIYRIDLDHIIHGRDFFYLSKKLTQLAEGIIRTALRLSVEEMVNRYGHPRTAAGLEAAHAVLGLGKLGGMSLGYASDLELLFVYGDNGETDGPEVVSNSIFFEQLFRLSVSLIEAKREGIFQIDLRLRPHGKSGPVAVSLDQFTRYYSPNGESKSYERLALTMLREIGGDPVFGDRVERLRDNLIYSYGSIDLEELRSLREKQFAEKTKGKLNAKFSPGALVDLEYSLQILMIRYGMENPALRTTSMHQALTNFGKAGIVSSGDAKQLQEAYSFLRSLINSLRMLRGNAQDLFLPDPDSSEYIHLARRMGYSGTESMSASDQLHLDFQRRTADVRNFIEQYLGRESIPGPPQGNAADLVLTEALPEKVRDTIIRLGGFSDIEKAYRNIRKLAGTNEQREQFATTVLLAWDIFRRLPDPGMALNNWEAFVKSIDDPVKHFRRLSKQPKRLEILLEIFSGSQFLSDILRRNPAFIDYVTNPDTVKSIKSTEDLIKDFFHLSSVKGSQHEWLKDIREYRRREILRIGTRDICLWAPIEEVVIDLSNLADAVLNICMIRLKSESFDPSGICILAFGKLGGQELNYSSDIDLLAIYDPLKTDEKTCRKLMERLRDDLSKHTKWGYGYRIDLRLRPYGRSGNLVVPIDAAIGYYEKNASPWELQALIKTRPVAGDVDLGNYFLESVYMKIQSRIDYPAFLRENRELRKKSIEKLDSRRITAGIDVKNGRGGIRDIEFSLQALQMKALLELNENPEGNTLAAMNMMIDRKILSEAAVSKLKWNYIFLRRIEHYLQLFEDRQIHAVPKEKKAVETLAKRLLSNSEYQISSQDPDEFIDFISKRMDENRSFYNSVTENPAESNYSINSGNS